MTGRRNTASRGSTDRQAEIKVVSEAAMKRDDRRRTRSPIVKPWEETMSNDLSNG